MRTKEEYYIPTEQISAIVNALEQEPLQWKTLILLLMETGARVGEILGLKWDKVDFDQRKIRICNSIAHTFEGSSCEQSLKSAVSYRFLPLSDKTVRLLKQHKERQDEKQSRSGESYQDLDYVFTQKTGRPMRTQNVSDWFSDFCKRHELPYVTPYAFRHTMLITSGKTQKVS